MREAKNSSKQRLFEFLLYSNLRKKFDGILPDLSNINSVFDANYQDWKNKNKNNELVDKFELSEMDFIDDEQKMLSNIDFKKLKETYYLELNHENFNFKVVQKKIQNYRKYLKNKLKNPIEASKTFQEIFYNPKDYVFIKDLLVENKYYALTEDEWTPPFHGNTTSHKYLTALYVVLFERGYVKKVNNKIASQALSNEFCFVLNAASFGRNMKAIDFDEVKEEYLFIPKNVK